MENKITRLIRGLFKDSSPEDQPEGSYPFALNAIKETDQGDNQARSNEESNEICAELPEGYRIMGKTYMGKDRICLFLCNGPENISEIGIFYSDSCKYETHVNDENSLEVHKLNFRLDRQIEAVYRLRRGCEDTVYFISKDEYPRYYNFSSPKDFKNQNDNWVADKFRLQKPISRIPEFQNVEVLEAGGNMPPGSYNFAIQFLDESMNLTEVVATSPTVKIYNDSESLDYPNINGSINSEDGYINFPVTNKSIKLEFSNLDDNYIFFRVAIIESNNGTGQISSVKFSEPISTKNPFFYYTGDNFISRGTEEDIIQIQENITSAETIVQLENRLLLGNTKGNQIPYCELQKYASQIKVDCITKSIRLDSMDDPKNSRSSAHEFNNGIGYMPGEIYSIAIAWLFDDLTVSPGFHIPGKAEGDENIVFSPLKDENNNDIVFPMATNNQGESLYIDNSTCNGVNYWGEDYNGVPLVAKNIRHHRFPYRKDIKKSLAKINAGVPTITNYYFLNLYISGKLKIPKRCPENDPQCGTDVFHTFEIRISYTVQGDLKSEIFTVNPQTYADNVSTEYDVELLFRTPNYDSSDFNNIVIEITDLDGIFHPVSQSITDLYFNDTPTIIQFGETEEQVSQGLNYTSEILGLRLSNIERPKPINGKEIIGYYIVRNERTESDKTILDSAVMFPTLSHEKYISHGLLFPQPYAPIPSLGVLQNSVWSILHPEHKFNDKHLLNYDELVIEGFYEPYQRNYGKVSINDVDKGSSYSGGNDHDDDAYEADGSPDSRGLDGWSLDLITRDNIVAYHGNFSQSAKVSKSNIIDDFYLDALENKTIQMEVGALQTTIVPRDVYNITADNKIKIIQFKKGYNFLPGGSAPYVVFYKENKNPYSNFRTSKYYKEHTNPIYFGTSDESTTNLFNGDSYITPMRYVNTMFWQNRIAKRNGTSSTWKYVLGAVMVVIGTVLSVAGGIGAPLLIGGLVVLAGAGVLTISSGIKQDNYFKTYGEEYDKGLRTTALDSWVDIFYNYKAANPFGFPNPNSTQYGKDGPSDDSIQWIGDAATNLWFESAVNMNLRNRFYRDETPTYLNAPWKAETGNDSVINLITIYQLNYQYSNPSRYPVSSLERHLLSKLTVHNPDWNDNRRYLGLALGEYYNLNPDYLRREKQKIFFHLPLEYDCCSDCNEVFPHRIHYSEQSFQEELSDNYSVFLPNNYRDIDGETGAIKHMFTLGERLFILTEEGLWNMPSNHQERVTDQIVSFIGTGDYFSIPPRKIIEDESGNTAGTSHSRGVVKTPLGVVFPNARQNKMFLFNGEGINAISEIGLSSWFKKNSNLLTDDLYRREKREDYPYLDNPSNPFGTGYVAGYDSRKGRVMMTKKDKKISLPSGRDDFELCMKDGEMIIFENMDDILEEEEVDGWEYTGIKNCRMRFSKTIKEEVASNVAIMGFTEIVGSAGIHIILPEEPQTTSPVFVNLIADIDNWISETMALYPDWNGELYKHYSSGNDRWLKTPLETIKNEVYEGSLVGANIMVINLLGNNGQSNVYSDDQFETNPVEPNADYQADLEEFRDVTLPSMNSFVGVMIPVVMQDDDSSKQFFLHAASSLVGKQLSQEEFYTMFRSKNNGFDKDENSYLENYMVNAPNTFETPLQDLGWVGIWDVGAKNDEEDIGANSLYSSLNNVLLSSFTTTTTPTISVTQKSFVIHKYVDGTPYEEGTVDNSWTLSYDLKENNWISWHSYLPYVYLGAPEKMFSTDSVIEGIWKHNKLGHYQNFYGERKPFIMEYTSNESPVTTKIWDYIRLMTESKKYHEEYEEFTEERFITFDKALFYNSRQNSGILNLIVKDTDGIDSEYLKNQVRDLDGDSIIIDRNERDWTLNSIRDIRVDHTIPMFKRKLEDLQDNYFIDKVLNEDAIDFDKPWSEQEVFRDKYLTIRLIFDTFDDIKLILKYSSENEGQSFR